MHTIGQFIRLLLWSIFSIIIFLLLVGLAKSDRSVGTYVSFLNNQNRRVFHWSQPATWTDPFWSNQQISGNIADMLSNDATTTGSTGLDAYDPALEQDLNSVANGSLSDSGQDYGFTATGQTSSNTSDITLSGTTSKSELLNVIKNSSNTKNNN